MAAAFDNSSRSWWSMAKAHNDGAPEYHSEKPKPKSKSLHSLFGRKSKKHCPTLAIEDPPLPIQPIPSEYAQSFNNRPLSKSVSSTRSRNDSLEPRTPSDFHHNHNIARHSLLTLSDTDPFASGRSVGIASPQLPSDPTRLSAYSNTSSTEQHQRKNVESVPFQRASYASSSYSQNHAPESPVPLSPVPPIANGFHGKLLTKRSDTALNGNRARQPSSSTSSGTASGISSNMPSRPPTRPRGLTDIGAAQKSGFFVDKQSSASSLTTSSAKSSDSRPPPTRPPSSRRPSNASSGSRVPPVSSPRVVIRQASIQGLSQPAPPPTQRLPAPPAHSHAGNDIPEMSSSKLRRERSNSTLGSKISFASVLSTEVLPSPPPVATHIRPRRVSDRSVFKPGVSDIDKTNTVDRKPSFSPLTPPMTLKKALSHQSLIKRGPLFSTPSSSTTPTSPQLGRDQNREKEKASHKLRIFPHSKTPVPPIPPKHSDISGSTIADSSPHEPKRTSVSSVRKRLFSGSSLRRPSTSHSTAGGDEDTQSVFSVKSEQDLYINTSFFKPWITTKPSHPSFWDQASPDTVPPSPARSTTEPVIPPTSPTLGRYELTREAPPISFSSPTLTSGSRQRGFSMRSTSTVASTECDGESVMSKLSPRSQSSNPPRFQRSNTITTSPHGTNTNQSSYGSSTYINAIGRPRTATISSITPRKTPERPSTAQPALNSGAMSCTATAQSSLPPTGSSPPLITSLPPPPRRTRRQPLITQPEDPPPSEPVVIALPPPPSIPARAPRAKMTFEKILLKRSIMRKPSFLEISDDDDDDLEYNNVDDEEDVIQLFDDPTDREREGRLSGPNSASSSTRPPLSAASSFLDFARDSFDTTRGD